MSYCEVTLEWPGGEDKFALTWDQLRALEGLADKGPMALLADVQGGTWRVDDLINILRLGLIGAGIDPVVARKRVIAASELHPVAAFVQPAMLILAAGLMGVSDQDVDSAAGDGKDAEGTEASDG